LRARRNVGICHAFVKYIFIREMVKVVSTILPRPSLCLPKRVLAKTVCVDKVQENTNHLKNIYMC